MWPNLDLSYLAGPGGELVVVSVTPRMKEGDDALYGNVARDESYPLDLENRRTLFEL